jgi:hypothetical protein
MRAVAREEIGGDVKSEKVKGEKLFPPLEGKKVESKKDSGSSGLAIPNSGLQIQRNEEISNIGS